MKSVLVCDDHAMMRMALAGAVSMIWPDTHVSTAENFEAAWLKAAEAPQLILCDLSMPGADPLSGIDRMRQAAPDTPLLVVTGNEDDAMLIALFDLGIAGFVPKSASAEVIEAAIRIVAAGSRYIPPRVIELVQARSNDGIDQAKVQELGVSRLSDRQIEVLKLIATGVANKEIARTLNLSPATVKTHVASVLSALNAANRTEAVFKAREIRLI